MVSTLGNLLDRLQGFFSKNYFLAGFLPAAVFVVINAVVVYVLFPETRNPILALLDLEVSTQVVNWVLALVSTYVLGIIIWSLLPWLRHLLEGRYLPFPVRSYLQGLQYDIMRSLDEERVGLEDDRFNYRKAANAKPNWIETLRKARGEGEKSCSTAQIPGVLKAEFNNLKRMQQKWHAIPFLGMEHFFSQLKDELENKNANQLPELDNLHVDFIKLFKYACERIEIQPEQVQIELLLRFPRKLSRLGPTALANVFEVNREYGIFRYGLDIELFWLGILKIVKADGDFYPILDDMKTQLDFSTAMTSMLGLVTIVWFVPSMLLASSIYPFLIIGLIGPVITSVFYRMVVETARAYTEAVRSAIDFYRFDLLKALHIELPNDSNDEIELFRSISVWPIEERKSVKYKHEGGDKLEKVEHHESFLQSIISKIKKWLGLG